MSLNNYGVLKGKILDSKYGSDASPHYQILVEGEEQTKYRVAVNIKSQSYPSEVLYFVSDQFQSEDLAALPNLPAGFTDIKNNNPDIALDFIRGNLFDPKKMVPLPADVEGPDNDLNEKLSFYIEKAQQEKAVLYAFGQRWGPENNTPDQYFGFTPGNGIHDIHMNQGNVGRWKRDNGTWQDGGLMLYFEESNSWVGTFLAFQSQSWCTDDQGNAVLPVEKCNYLNYDQANRKAKQ
ncbi:Uncharacterized protein YukJ [Fictibacillus solisalsi]|uniref:Uncharacterized protein YukJ n=1 Tax=Fictibacillus solisalsi TaxID=459525 RepID=A0A1G9VPC7_9BACL|nr:YukJ family protein [Fictibacillus solisalsi]SDM73841.1 Uncharacterized protein YukJ [Fictibacillus solisalsi]